ncbi:MAG: dihydroorotase [Flavobacteriales bacterium]|nr:dihydroorotase [Flavobacteriales bacterium]
MNYLLRNGLIINEGKRFYGDIFLKNGRIEKIGVELSINENYTELNLKGKYVMPGFIDDQVHFREPGLTNKATIASESRAAVAGGITSFIEQPNTVPNAVTQEILEDKYVIASKSSIANYSFMMGGTNDNLDEILKTNPRNVAGLKLFLGSSTGDMLVDSSASLEKIFSNTKLLIAVHSEDETTVKTNLERFKAEYGDDIPVKFHPEIRSVEACYKSTVKVIDLAKRTGARLHVFHISTAKELDLFDNSIPLEQKKITAEVCVHHLWFSDEDYATKGNFIKWNPAVKAASDRKALWEALLDDRIDVIATDHAPHTLEEKAQVYTKAPSGGPLVQHALIALLEKSKQGVISLERLVQKTAHNPAILFNIEDRGFIREGYKADLVVVDPNKPTVVTKEQCLYKCGWSPFEGEVFSHSIDSTFVNGNLVWTNGQIQEVGNGERLLFSL